LRKPVNKPSNGYANIGAMFVAYGQKAIQCFYDCADSLRVHHPDMPIVVIGDQSINFPNCMCLQEPSTDIGARSIKTQIWRYVPDGWTYALYMDVDTLVLKPLDRFLQPLLDGWELVMVRDELADVVDRCRLKNNEEKQHIKNAFGTGELTQFAGGLFSWRICPTVQRFFETWHAEWGRFSFRDQGALVRALALTPVKLWPLGWAANASNREHALEVWHIHGKARMAGAQ